MTAAGFRNESWWRLRTQSFLPVTVEAMTFGGVSILVLSEAGVKCRASTGSFFLLSESCLMHVPSQRDVCLSEFSLSDMTVEAVFDIGATEETFDDLHLFVGSWVHRGGERLNFLIVFVEDDSVLAQKRVGVWSWSMKGFISLCRVNRDGIHDSQEARSGAVTGMFPTLVQQQMGENGNETFLTALRAADQGARDANYKNWKMSTQSSEIIDTRVEKRSIVKGQTGSGDINLSFKHKLISQEIFNADPAHHIARVLAKIEGKSKRKILHVLDINDLIPLFSIPRDSLAKQLGICVTLLKKLCRKNGIRVWPYRKLLPVERKLLERRNDLSRSLLSTESATRDATVRLIELEINQLYIERQEILSAILRSRAQV
ncbi:hypothetical protein NDN08_006259 [Rhodosorus marinus]|uniref:RWP-RK domain-containing protein n=1 Tax=Rhodosorus marinus TaxID=101924 RepID=A0AAV8UNA7_9RHOD|nr:hypothetical protein NDN08_006259 [Rhodosorus marinus]